MASTYEHFSFFSYHFSHRDEDVIRERTEGKQCIIRCYGWNERNESMLIRIEDMLLPVHIELPDYINWTQGSINVLIARLRSLTPQKCLQPVSIDLIMKQKSHYAHVEKINEPDSHIRYKHKTYPFLTALFSSVKACELFTATLRRELKVLNIGSLKLKCHSAERSLTPILKLVGLRKLPTAGWIKGKGIRLSSEEKESTKMHEFAVSFKHLIAMSEQESLKMPIIFPKVMSFDCEMNSSIANAMPKATEPLDKVFQISYTITETNADKSKKIKKVLLSLGNPEPLEDITIKRLKTEADLLVQFAQDIRSEDPDVITGYNILSFDINYMIQRVKLFGHCMGEFDQFGCIPGKHAVEIPISWSSSAYGKQNFIFLEAEGRLFIDVLPYVKRNYKLHNYRLDTVCREFLKDSTKDPLTAKDIFRLYKQFTPEGLAKIGKYCCQDSYVTYLLYEKLLIWYDLTESATVNKVPIFDMIVRGQQIKAYSQIQAYCHENGIIMLSDAYNTKDDEHYTGAYVSEPEIGLYDMVFPFDFCLSGDTLISTASGTSQRLKNISTKDVLTYTDNGLKTGTMLGDLQIKGEKPTVRIWLQDGTIIISTPDHKFLTYDKQWCRADELKDKYIMCGVNQPEDIHGDDEKLWSFKCGNHEFNMKEGRDDTLAFSRIIGFGLAKGLLWVFDDIEIVKSDSAIDVKSFNQDVIRLNEIITHKKIEDINTEEKKALEIAGISYHNLIKFILDEKCPIAIIREFLAGLYGGSGFAPYLSGSGQFSNIFLRFTDEKWDDYLLKHLCVLHERFSIRTILEVQNRQINIPLDDTCLFAEKIGFRYCVNKSLRLSIAHSYFTMINKVSSEENAVNYVNSMDAMRLFKDDEKSEISTVFRKRVIAVIPYEVIPVYDIEVKDSHCFVANGAVAHNCSLYPSIMMGYNIDFSKLVTDPDVPDEDCHVMKWEEHSWCRCPKDKEPMNKKPPKMKDGKAKHICASYYYRWLKAEVSGKGILPTILETLISARKRTRKIIATNEDELKILRKIIINEDLTEEQKKILNDKLSSNGFNDTILTTTVQKWNNRIVKLSEKEVKIIQERIEWLESLNLVLDRRQNAYKVNANSIYGLTGAKKGYAPFLPAAMCVTYMGRTNIQIVNKYIFDKCKGRVIYNDTDSAYVIFPFLKDRPISELWTYAKNVSEMVKKDCFADIPTLNLDFEGKIYKRFFILTKKRYAAQAINDEGKEDSKIVKRGIVLQRRDNFKLLRTIYQKLVTSIFEHHSTLISLKGLSKTEIMKNPIVVDMLRDIALSVDSLFRWGNSLHDFVITKAMTREAMEYKNPARLPTHVQLALKMQKRGQLVGAGSRIEYVILKSDDVYKKTMTQKDRICDIDYMMEYREILRVCFLTYLKTVINPVDELCEVIIGISNFVKQLWEWRIQYSKVVAQIASIGRSKLIFLD